MLGILSAADKDYIKVDIGDIKFYLIASLLFVALLVLVFVFTKSKRFKAKQREKIIRSKEMVYVNPTIIKVGKSDINKEILESGDRRAELHKDLTAESETTADVKSE